MATKAEWFRYFQERSSDHPAAGAPAPSATAAPAVTPRAAKLAVYAREETMGRPTRKSTRKSANRQKTDVQFRMKRREQEGQSNRRP